MDAEIQNNKNKIKVEVVFAAYGESCLCISKILKLWMSFWIILSFVDKLSWSLENIKFKEVFEINSMDDLDAKAMENA